MLRHLIIFISSIVLFAIAATVPVLGGRTLIGFKYCATVDNSRTVCPDRVVSQSGNTITLSTGQQLRVDGDPAALASALVQANNWVKLWKDDMLSMRQQSHACGNGPEDAQVITIPLFATETFETHHSRDFAYCHRLPATSAGPVDTRAAGR
jgi:hypothetical protein